MTAAISRRSLLAGGMAAAAFSRAGAEPAASSVGGLRGVAAERGILYGSYIDLTDRVNGPAYPFVAAHECGLNVGPGMDWKFIAPTPDRTDFAVVDKSLAWGESHDMKFQGHSLVWGETVPPWFEQLPDRAAAIAALRNHVATLCRHFAGRTHSWVVVNEALSIWSGRPDNLLSTAFLRQIGPEHIDIAFEVARENDPHALLIYNDYDIEMDLPPQNAKRAALLDLLDGLRKRNSPINAIGLQSHLYYELMPHFNEKQFSGFLADIAARGCQILISELDVADKGAPSDIATRDADVAAIYKRYLDVALDNRAVKTVITWGLADKESWVVQSHKPEYVRSDGLEPRPLPFDDDYRPKPAYFAMVDAFRAAPHR